MSRSLDALVARAHRLAIGGRRYHPYFLATDVAVVVSLAAAFALIRRHGNISFLGFVAVYATMLALYRGFLWFKARVFGIQSRSFLQDSVLFLLPAYALVCRLAGYPLAFAFDLTAVILPIFGGFARIGCFLGGCCYGVPSAHGVLYPAHIFQPVDGCRRFRPGADPGTRVMPTQLIESAGLFVIGAAIFDAEWTGASPPGAGMPVFLLSYSALRFGVDFYRRSSARPRIGRFSEAQVFALIVAAVSVVLLVVLAARAPA